MFSYLFRALFCMFSALKFASYRLIGIRMKHVLYVIFQLITPNSDDSFKRKIQELFSIFEWT